MYEGVKIAAQSSIYRQLYKRYCNSRLPISHFRLRKTGPITIGSRVRDTISCAFIPNSVGANSVCIRHDTTNSVTA